MPYQVDHLTWNIIFETSSLSQAKHVRITDILAHVGFDQIEMFNNF